MTEFFVGLDLGQANDYTAISVVERLQNEKETTYNVRFLERVRGAPYPDIVKKVTPMMRSMGLAQTTLVVDQTGVGAPVVDLFHQAGLYPVGICIHGRARVTQEGYTWGVPKRDLVGVLQVLLQSSRLNVASKLELRAVLIQEMLNFKVKIDPVTAHDSYSAWRERDHDDLVLSVALAAWWGEQNPLVELPPVGPFVCGSPGYDGPI